MRLGSPNTRNGQVNLSHPVLAVDLHPIQPKANSRHHSLTLTRQLHPILVSRGSHRLDRRRNVESIESQVPRLGLRDGGSAAVQYGNLIMLRLHLSDGGTSLVTLHDVQGSLSPVAVLGSVSMSAETSGGISCRFGLD